MLAKDVQLDGGLGINMIKKGLQHKLELPQPKNSLLLEDGQFLHKQTIGFHISLKPQIQFEHTLTIMEVDETPAKERVQGLRIVEQTLPQEVQVRKINMEMTKDPKQIKINVDFKEVMRVIEKLLKEL